MVNTMTKKRKILIIRFGAIGDIIWTSLVIRCLKTQLQDSEIHFVTKKKFHSLIAHNPYIDKVYVLDSSVLDLVRELKKERYDIVLDLHKNLRSHIIKWLLCVKSYSYQKLNLRRWAFTRFQWHVMPNYHVAERYLAAAAKLGVINDGKGLDFFIAPEDHITFTDFLPNTHLPHYAVYVIGGSKFTKLMPLDGIIKLCTIYDKPIVLIGGPEDEITGNEIAKKCRNVINLAGKLSLGQSAYMVANAVQVIGHDTGLMHLAAAFHPKVYGIYGGTSPVGYYPYTAQPIILEKNDLDCRPCSRSGLEACPKGHFKCLSEFSEIELKDFLTK